MKLEDNVDLEIIGKVSLPSYKAMTATVVKQAPVAQPCYLHLRLK